MKRLLVLSLLMASFGCRKPEKVPAPVPSYGQFQVSKEEARKRLSEKGLKFDKWVFLEHITGGDYDTVMLFLRAGMSPNVKGEKGCLALEGTAGHGNIGMTQILLDAGADPNERGCLGTALHMAAEDGDLETVRLLLKSGADIKAKDFRGNTVLHYAVGHGGNTATISELLKAGVEINSLNSWGKTALDSVVDGYPEQRVVLEAAGAKTAAQIKKK